MVDDTLAGWASRMKWNENKRKYKKVVRVFQPERIDFKVISKMKRAFHQSSYQKQCELAAIANNKKLGEWL